jgi:RNA 2',3'-cyclic 3'-phosphodiesterase
MTLLRAFIAVEIPSGIHQEIDKKMAPIRAALNASLVRWVPAENVHLTLKFLGDVSPANLELLEQMLSVEVSQHRVFELGFGGLGAFPNPKRPRVIWIGIQAPAALGALQHGIEAATATLGYPDEQRSFSPHLTIGRVKQNVGSVGMQQIRSALEETKVDSLGTTQVSAVHLFRSDLKPTGAEYTRLFSVPLKT